MGRKKRIYTMRDRLALDEAKKMRSQADEGLRRAMREAQTLRKDREWIANELRRLRGILDTLSESDSDSAWIINGIEYEKRILRTPEEIEVGNGRFATD